MRDPKDIFIVLLLLTACVLGYLYYDSQQHELGVNAPGFNLQVR